jgi:hypothetical protein
MTNKISFWGDNNEQVMSVKTLQWTWIDSEAIALDQGKQRTLNLLVTIPNMLTQFVQENDKLTTLYKKLCNTGMNLKEILWPKQS